MQPGVVQTQLGAGVHARLLPKPDPRLEIPKPHPSSQANGSLVQSTVPGPVAGRRGHRDRSGRRDSKILERVQQGQVAERNQIGAEPVHRHSIKAFYILFLPKYIQMILHYCEKIFFFIAEKVFIYC